MWRSIIGELETNGNLGPALPISCYRHRDDIQYVSEPGKLPLIAPDGRYLVPRRYGICSNRFFCRRMHATLRYSVEVRSSVSFQGNLLHGLASPSLMVFSVIVMIRNTQPSFARSPAGGFVQEIILATSNAAHHAANVCSLSQVSNFPAAM